MITQTILDQIYPLIRNLLVDKVKYGAVGTDNATPQVTDTQLGNEVFREELYSITVDDSSKEISAVMWLDITEANGHVLKEFGIFDSSTDGDMVLREVFPDLEKNEYKEVIIEAVLKIEITQ